MLSAMVQVWIKGLVQPRGCPSVSVRAWPSTRWPALERLLPAYPDIRVEVHVDNTLSDLVAGRYDAGIRIGELVGKDMVAVRIGPELRMAVVGAPAYFARRPPPSTPQDLTGHACINLRLPTHDSLYAWEF